MHRTLTVGAAAALLLFAAPAAQAADPLASGNTTLRIDAAVARALTAGGVRVTPVAPARGGVAFPITGGSLDGARGTIRHSGGLRFSAGGRSLTARSFTVSLGRRATLSGSVGGSRVTLIRLDTSRARVTRPGLDTRITRVRASLTTAAARALNATLGTHLFRGGLELGSVTVRARPRTVELRGGTTAVALDAGAAGALQSLGIAATPIGTDALAFPITGGRVNARTYAGSIAHSGGIALTRGATRVELTEFEIGIDGTPELTALVGGTRVPILTVDLAALKATASNGAITLEGAALKLTAAAAGALNQAFSTTAFTEGLLLGTATVAADTNEPTAVAASRRTYGATTLTLDAGAVAALTGLGVTPAPIAPAQAVAAGTLAFPITTPPIGALFSGAIRHSGGIALTAGATTVRLESFTIEPLRRQLTALVGGARVPILALDFSRARLGLGGGSLTLGPVAGALTPAAAGALNQAFGLPAGTVPAGLKLGDATVRYRLY